MGALEIVLLVLGCVVFLLSFFLPSGAGGTDEEIKKILENEAKDAVAREMKGVKGQIEDIVDETVNYAVEKTERSLERVSNEKIMAVNEYSDTVLEDINKNHKEVMFLYDMLNDKHQNIQSTVSQVEKTVKEVEQTAREAAAGIETVIGEKSVAEETQSKATAEEPVNEEEEFSILMPQKVSAKKVIKSKPAAKKAASEPALDISFMKDGRKNGNNNERILELHNQGKSNVAIAKELGLGVGEVKLVIDLFEGM